jgi:putative ABC transport system ATP-binding protein
MDNILQTSHLTKIYQMGEVSVIALDDVDFSVAKGEFVAIMGPSGSGKSTLLHMLGGLDAPSSGEILLARQPLEDLSDDQIARVRRQKVGFIFQFYNLLPTLSAAENVALPLLIDGKTLTEVRSQVDELLEMVGLSDRADHRPEQLSGGQQQRVAIARAFVNQPEIVLADEPTGNLDSRAGTAILELLRRVCRELEATIIMVTHDARAASYADRVVFLKDGQVIHELKIHGGRVSVREIVKVMTRLEL